MTMTVKQLSAMFENINRSYEHGYGNIHIWYALVY